MSGKMMEQLLNLRLMSKSLQRSAKKSVKTEKAEKLKLKKAIEQVRLLAVFASVGGIA